MKASVAQLGLDLSAPIPPTRPQGKKALQILQAARERGVSGVQFVEAYLFAYSQELGRLRRRGYEIVSGKMPDSQVAIYWLAEYAPKDEA